MPTHGTEQSRRGAEGLHGSDSLRNIDITSATRNDTSSERVVEHHSSSQSAEPRQKSSSLTAAAFFGNHSRSGVAVSATAAPPPSVAICGRPVTSGTKQLMDGTGQHQTGGETLADYRRRAPDYFSDDENDSKVLSKKKTSATGWWTFSAKKSPSNAGSKVVAAGDAVGPTSSSADAMTDPDSSSVHSSAPRSPSSLLAESELVAGEDADHGGASSLLQASDPNGASKKSKSRGGATNDSRGSNVVRSWAGFGSV